MKNEYIFLCLAGQLFIYITWGYFVKRESVLFWKTSRTQRLVFFASLLAAAGFHAVASHNDPVERERFYALQLGGEIILKVCFIISLTARLAYIFLVDRTDINTLKNVNRAINSLTALLLTGFILFNVTSYVWLSEILIVPVSLFVYSLQK